MSIAFGILVLLIHNSQCQTTNFLLTSAWYGSPSAIEQARGPTVNAYDCLKNLGLTARYVSDRLSLLSSLQELGDESSRLINLNLTYAIGERNQLLNFIYPLNTPGLTLIGPMYPTDYQLMNVVIGVFRSVSGPSPNSSIMVIINRTQDFNNLAINNYENIVNYINNQKWTSVQFISYTNVDDIIFNLRKQTHFIIISLLYDPEVNKILIERAFRTKHMVWKYRWIIVDLLGGTNVLNNTEFDQGVLTNNVTIITFNANNLDGRQMLLQTAFNVTNNLRQDCATKMVTGTGAFVLGERTTFTYFVYQNPGNRSVLKGTITYNITNESFQVPSSLSYINFQMNEEESAKFIKSAGFRVGYINYPPFSMNNGTNYTGFLIELLTDVLNDFNETLKIVNITNNQIGQYYPANLTYSGFLGILQNQIVDTISVPSILTIDRLNNFDFVTNILDGYIVGVYKNVSLTGMDTLQYYAMPFDYRVWITLLCSALAIALSLAITDYINPDKFARFKLFMSLFFSISSLTHGAYFDPPKRTAGRIIMCFWWLFCIFVVVIWASNYAALLAKQINVKELSSINSLLSQNTRNYTAVKDSLVLQYLNTNPTQNLQLMNRIVAEEFINGTATGLPDAINLITNRSYVLLIDDKSVANYRYSNCLAVFGNFLSLNYGIVLPKFSEKTLSIKNKIAAKAAEGKIAPLIAKYFPLYNPQCTSNHSIEIIAAFLQNLIKLKYRGAFDVKEMISVFVLIILGSFLTLILALVERLIRLIIMKSQQRRNMYKYENTVEQLTHF